MEKNELLERLYDALGCLIDIGCQVTEAKESLKKSGNGMSIEESLKNIKNISEYTEEVLERVAEKVTKDGVLISNIIVNIQCKE